MYEGASVCVVIPAYNEAEFIGEVIETIPEFVDGIVVVDDHSTDGTWEVIRSLAAERNTAALTLPTPDGGVSRRQSSLGRPVQEAAIEVGSFPADEIVAVRHETNGGRGEAVKTGYRIAMTGGFDIVAVMDGDGQMDPAILDRIVDPVATGVTDYAKGNRLASRHHCREMPRWRLLGNVLLTILTKISSGYWGVRDPQNGYTAISMHALDRLQLDALYDDYGFLNDILSRLRIHDFRVADVPMQAQYGDESSGISYRSFVPNLSLLLFHRFLWRLWVMYGVTETS